MRGEWRSYRLNFRFTAITSRERLRQKDTYFIRLWHTHCPTVSGLGEAALFRGLSCDDRPGYEDMLDDVCAHPDRYASDTGLLDEWPSIKTGFETALADLASGGVMRPFRLSRGVSPLTASYGWATGRQCARESTRNLPRDLNVSR